MKSTRSVLRLRHHKRVPFVAPKTQAFRRFVMLDASSVLAALSALDGGAVDEILTRRVEESDRALGGEVAIPVVPLKGKAKRASGHRIEEELKQVRTEHSAAAALLDGLKQREAVGLLEGALDADAYDALQPGMVIELSGQIEPHPLFRLDTVIRNFIKVAPKLGQGKPADDLRRVMPMFQAVAGTGDESGRVLFDVDTGAQQRGRIIAFADRSSLQVRLEDFSGQFSTLAQVDEVMRATEDEMVTMRLVRGAPPSAAERSAIIEGAEVLIDAANELGVALSEDDLVMPSPLVVLRPLCIWR